MQDATPQGEPRRQKADHHPRVTTGFVDPCIISMETTLPGEIAMLVQFWAAGSREIRGPGALLHWELNDVVVFKSFLHRKKFHLINEWSFKMHRERSLSLPCPKARSTRLCDLSALFDHVPEQIYQWHIRYLDVAVEARLRQAFARHDDRPGSSRRRGPQPPRPGPQERSRRHSRRTRQTLAISGQRSPRSIFKQKAGVQFRCHRN